MERAERCKNYLSTQMQHKHQAGYFNANVNKDAFNYIRDVLTNPDKPPEKSDIIASIRTKIDNESDPPKKQNLSKESSKEPPKKEEDQKKSSKLDPDLVR